MEEVQQNFRSTNISTNLVKFVQGFHNDTMPFETLPDEISILRLDSDMYESTMDILYHLWERVTTGGIIINDDAGLEVHNAIQDFYKTHGQNFDEITKIEIDDTHAYYWQKENDFKVKYETYYNYEKVQKMKNSKM